MANRYIFLEKNNKSVDIGIDRSKESGKRIKFDFMLLFSSMLISCFGVLIIYSATRYSLPEGVGDPQYFMKRQAVSLAIGIVTFSLMLIVDYKKIKRFLWAVVLVNLSALISVLVFGYQVHGAKRWIDLGFTSIQPSEISKVLTVVIIAAIFSKWKGEKQNKVGFKKVVLSLLAISVSIAIVILQNDLGTALVFFLFYMGMLFISGANFLYFISIAFLATGGIFFGLKAGLIKQYHLDRIMVFLKPETELEGIGYNLFQSKLAIGSGGLWGNGLFLGKQTNLSYVPEHHTDFIFSVIGEELGFLGVLFVILLIGIVVWRCFFISSRSSDNFGSILCAGIGFIILIQTFINIGMTIGIMPIIGIPLPFLSYGGSSLISIFIGLGLVENVYMRTELRKDYEIAYQEY